MVKPRRPARRTSVNRRLAPTAATLGGVLLAWLLALGCSTGGPEPDRPPPNLLLVSIDTLRADRLGCYGHDRDTSPNLDRLASEAIRFQEVFAPAPWTLPSHAGMLTGVHPHRLGLKDREGSLPPDAPLVAELLATAGYETAAFVDSRPGGFVGAKRGFGRGFELFEHAPHAPGRSYTEALEEGFVYDTADTVDAAQRWLEARDAERPFFLFLHTKSVHTVPEGTPSPDHRTPPYDQPAAFRMRFAGARADFSWNSPEMGSGVGYLKSLNHSYAQGSADPADFPADLLEELKAQYDAGVYYVDAQIGRLLESLESLELMDNTAIVVVSDHGEEFLEHGRFMHKQPYRQLLHVPVIIRLPQGRRGEVVAGQRELVAVAATLLDLAGVAPPPHLQQGSLLDEPAEGDEGIFGYLMYTPDHHDGQYRGFSLRRGDWNLVYHNPGAVPYRAEFYDSSRSPLELEPVEPSDERERAMLRELKKAIQRPPDFTAGEYVADAETTEFLRALGYIF